MADRRTDLGGILLEMALCLLADRVPHWAQSSIVLNGRVCPMVQEVLYHLPAFLSLHHHSVMQWSEARVADIVVDSGAELSVPHRCNWREEKSDRSTTGEDQLIAVPRY